MLPDADDLPGLLLDLAVPHEDINGLVAQRRRITGDPGLLRLVEECVEELFRGPEGTGHPPDLAELFAAAPADLGRTFPVYVFVAAVPRTLDRYRERGIPPEISRRTLADLGRHMAAHRRRHGATGLRTGRWLVRHFRGELFQLGRLQFERARLGQRSAPVLAAAGVDAVPGTPCLNLHIPDFHGPLTPSACDRSLTWAREFFARYFPEERPVAALCHSWLLDPQLRRYLPADSNIIRFQDRFRTAREDTEPADTEPVQFVFGNPDLPVAELPRRTSVERAVGDHLRTGGHWYIGHGWFPFQVR
ncbi:acyltransferase domain-containing protein [Streptomyces sp. FXJ1.172]|uniref:acyltransferase domain-containing protein n=1 Tax=Streptomyces sp. FXJ1.172 TaxID=710705 RepID=UPI0007CF8C7C|nr:acyltransferase domain-containing protein [Streptomyces sp. FXJ1.172]WEO98064.1 acyltransferase domain-containing protein [Streptomyces sp. FXJ1.172]